MAITDTSVTHDAVQITYDYDKFKLLQSNRDVNKYHINVLKDSIKERDLSASHPIQVTQDFIVIDGQHRLAAWRDLQLPVYYKIVTDFEPEDVLLLNKNQKPWAIDDYIKFYVYKGNENYINLKAASDIINADVRKKRNSVHNISKITYTTVLSTLRGHEYGKEIKKGVLKFSQQDKAIILAILDKVEDFVPFYHYRHETRFLKAFSRIIKNPKVDINLFKRQLNEHKDQLERCANDDLTYNLLAKIYNLGKGRQEGSKLLVAPR